MVSGSPIRRRPLTPQTSAAPAAARCRMCLCCALPASLFPPPLPPPSSLEDFEVSVVARFPPPSVTSPEALIFEMFAPASAETKLISRPMRVMVTSSSAAAGGEQSGAAAAPSVPPAAPPPALLLLHLLLLHLLPADSHVRMAPVTWMLRALCECVRACVCARVE